MKSTDSKILLICRNCGVRHSVAGDFKVSILEVESETFAEIDTIALVKECPDCWQKD